MRKNFMLPVILLLLTIALVACNHVSSDNPSVSSDQGTDIAKGSFASSAFFDIEEGTRLSDAELKTVIASIPRDAYEAYPETHDVPFSATLYKDGEVITIDPNDPRLIALTNFFNNCVYYSKCSYTQGLLSVDDIEEIETNVDFRLELKYAPYGDKGPSPYGTSTSRCDTIIVTNSYDGFTLIAHDLPGYEGQEDQYPFCAVGFSPLFWTYPWLDLFEF